MPKIYLTDRKLKSLKSAPAGTRQQYMDTLLPGFGVRVTDKGVRTFILRTRYPGSSNPNRRALGEYPAMSLEDARAKAVRWRLLVKQGIDPAVAEERDRSAALRRQENSLAAVAEGFIKEKLSTERKGAEAERDLRNNFVRPLGRRPITEVSELDVLGIIKEKRRTAPAQARNLLGLAKRFFAWTIDQRCYGLSTSPCEHLKPSKIIGEKVSGDRILSDEEVFALWRATRRIEYPHGPVYRLLTLTALRLNECADGAWPEIDPASRLWIIPPARMKGKNGKARAHVVPLSGQALGIIENLPRFKKGGPFLFSTTAGKKPVWMSDKVKKRLDARILRTLRALARRRGDDPAKVALAPWTNHDIRRTVRSRLSRLKITEEAREAVLAHARPGIKGTYDLYDYLDEKREALELWAAMLQEIISPRPSNVVKLRATA